MGVNMVGYCIKNNDIVENAAKKEVVRRYFNELCNYKQGISDFDTVQKIKLLMNELNIDENFL